MPSFNGLNIFGQAVSMRTSDNPRGEQQNAFPGLSGIEALDMGSRGRFTDVTGMLSGNSVAGLNFAESQFRSANDGNAYILVDMFGNAWPYVKYESFEPQGKVRLMTTGVYCRPYAARFRHLI